VIENSLYDILDELDKDVIIVEETGTIKWINRFSTDISKLTEIKDKIFTDFFSEDCANGKLHSIHNETYSYSTYHINKNHKELQVYIMSNDYSFDNYKVRDYCYSQIIDNFYEGILASDINGRIVIFNKQAERIEGQAANQMLNKKLSEVYFHKNDGDKEHEKVIKTKKPLLSQYKSFRIASGEGRYLSYSTYPIIKDGKCIAAYSESRNEEITHELLSQVIELKRKFRSGLEENTRNELNLSNGTIFNFDNIIGESEVNTNLIREAQTMARIDRNILIIGETGIGKEVFAQSIHNYGNRRKEPFVPINCAAIPDNLLESILFGTTKGAFTGAISAPGLFEEAGNGTLFLDELNSMPVLMQTKLLRVLQEKKTRRVGDTKMYPVYCRIISAINEDPKLLMEDGRLRTDLFYRIAALSLYLPPLRERKEDILKLAEYFITKYSNLMQKKIIGMDEQLKQSLQEYSWPGNIRQLDFVMENLVIRCHDNNYLTVDNMPEYLKQDFMKKNNNNANNSIIIDETEPLNEAIDNLEKQMIIKALHECNFNVTKAAGRLHIIRQSLRYRMKRLNIQNRKD